MTKGEPSKGMNFQDVMLELSRFWADRGCIIWQPYNVQVGAGTMNPATFLRVLGPEPWNVAYVEPSIRPTDGRYGKNPNRLQQFYQYQVILKPAPDDPQETYLKSLMALGIDPLQHDVRFVEDNWGSPALGAWGLGWEVWLDGLEITQFTYFQQAGGFDLAPVSVEITYGLERIVMFLQDARSVYDIDWGAELTYGDILLQGEIEHCRYNFEQADVERLVRLYNEYEGEAQLALEAGLVIPAYDYILKCSHTFNVLDARGAIGVTERASYFARMRAMSRSVAEAYLEQRERLGHPFAKLSTSSSPTEGAPACGVRDEKAVEDPTPKKVASQKAAEREAQADLVLEIGTEELPPGDVPTAMEQLKVAVPEKLKELRLSHQGIRVLGTPRRLVVLVAGLAPLQDDREEAVKGPPLRAAFDEAGKATPAAAGFARKLGISTDALQMRDFDGREYVVGVRVERGREAGEVLAEAIPELISSLHFDLSMRWDESGMAFARPIRWLVALLDSRVVDFAYAGVRSGRVSRGLRPQGSQEIPLTSADHYLQAMRTNMIVVDPDERRADVESRMRELAEGISGEIPDDPALLEEVTHMVESPTVVMGSFQDQYLELPQDVLITVMKKHQRYFPVVRDGKLLPRFMAIRNGGSDDLDVVRHGYEEVLHARYADAAFFFQADVARSLEDFVPSLAGLIFQEELGSVRDKVGRLERLIPIVGRMLGLDAQALAMAQRAGHLCKADLATNMVIEFTSLQGVMGREYARLCGEDEAVAQAIYEHYLPRFAGEALTESPAGIAVGLADRLDSLAGLFAVGLAPTGSADPYGLRRTALGLIQILIGRGISFDVEKTLREAAKLLPVATSEERIHQTVAFVAGRMRGLLLERGYRHDIVDSVLAERGNDPYAATNSVQALADWVEKPDWPHILAAYSRSKRIVREYSQEFPLDPDGFIESAERDLYRAYLTARQRVTPDSAVDSLLEALRELVEPITVFFDEVLVMDPNPVLRQNRLALLQRIASLSQGIMDLPLMMGF